VAVEYGTPLVCLLTWRGRGRQPLPANFPEFLRSRVRPSGRRHFLLPDDRWGRLYRNMKIVYDFNRGKGYPLQRPGTLPRVEGYN
jgi:hypothetical protein